MTVARRTKLVCTLGPATDRRIPQLVEAGMDVARLNFSHGTFDEHAARARAVRAAASAPGRQVAILADLPGPKIRVGDLGDGELGLATGDLVVLGSGVARDDDRPEARRVAIPIAYPRLSADVRAGDRILLADGAAELRVESIDGDDVVAEVVRGGSIRSRAGLSLPSERLSVGALTERDRGAIPWVRDLAAAFVAQSFVRGPADVAELRALLGDDGPPICAKIETRPAIDSFDAILGVVDAVMIARGDLGVELPYEEVPIVQKQLLRRALDRGVPTIVATQMLESMVSSPRPTRAEASDVANAVFDGADGIMLSAETAIGSFPVLAAEAADRIARLCEERGEDYLPSGGRPPDGDAGAIAFAAVALAAADREVTAIACYTRSGRTARMLSALRPRVPILAFSPDPAVVARLSVHHGVLPAACAVSADAEVRLEVVADLVRSSRLAPPGSAVVLVASTSAAGSGPNLLEVRRVAA